MDLQAVIGEIYLVDGIVQEAQPVPGLLSEPAPKKVSRGRERDYLFVHLSLSGRPSEYAPLAQAMLAIIREHYYQTSGSVTAGLRQAILAANQHLLRTNMSTKGGGRQGAIMCAVLRGTELYLVQAGEAFALISRNFGVERLPEKEPERVTPLGFTAGLDLRYFHNWLEPGDMLLLADPRLTNLPGQAVQSAVVESTVEESLPRLKEIIGRDTARVLLVEFVEDAPVGLPERSVGTAAAAAATTLPRQRNVRPQTARPAAPVPPPPATESDARIVIPQPTLPSRETVEAGARQASSKAARGVSRFTGWLASLMTRVRPEREPEAERTRNGWAVPALIAVLIPVLVAVIVTGVYVQRGRGQRVSQIRREMDQAIRLAEQAEDEVQKRQLYTRALVLAAEAELIRPDDTDIEILRQQALIELDLVDDVTRLLGRRLYTYPSGSSMSGIVLRDGFNGDIYALDSGENRVFRHETSEDYLTLTGEGPSQVLFGGQAIGPHVVGTLVDMIWRPSGNEVPQSGLAVLDRAGALITYIPTFARAEAARLGLASEWQAPVALSQFSERIYILDPAASLIWRYFPEEAGFYVDDEQRSIQLPDLEQAVDTAIYSEDGSVIVLYADGRLRRYVDGNLLWDENTLRTNGLETDLVAPTRVKILGRGLNSSIFVADPGSSRIVQVSLAGFFLAQYKAVDLETDQELFTSLRDFDVVDSPLRVFVVTPDALFVATED